MATLGKDALLAMIRDGKAMTLKQELRLTALLSIPAILAQLTSILMQYIDASMVGRLGADDSASIGLVSTTIWLFAGVCNAATTGFSVQVAHLIGAGRPAEARSVLRQSMITILIFGLAVGLAGCLISPFLPTWLKGNDHITGKASTYFLIFSLAIPFLTLDFLASGMLRSSGNIKVPSMLNVMMGALDVIFNFFLIFPAHNLQVMGIDFTLPGANLGVTGAALGTFLAEVITCFAMVYYMCFKSKELRLNHEHGSFKPRGQCLRKAFKISLPMGLQHIVMCSAQITITAIVAPLGSIALAANTFAITAESLCYMPGYGIADAATTLVGQSIGAARRDLTRRFANITVVMGMTVMGLMGVLMWIGAPVMMSIMSPVPGIIEQGTAALRIEAWAEPMFAAAIVSYGIFVGAGDTLIPCAMNVVSMWGVRITLSALFVLHYHMGLTGVWTAMCIELIFRGSIYLWRLKSDRWIKIKHKA